MSTLPHPVAIACADLHLSHKPPAARAGESSWYEAMGRPLQELSNLAGMLNVPVLCAGDVFHAHNPGPELVNFAIAHLPQMYAIPGQHDLPYHSQKEIEKSAFWTLVEAGTIKRVCPDGRYVGEGERRLWVQGFGWGQGVEPPKDNNALLNIALVHEYLWNGNAHYAGAAEIQNANVQINKFKPYDTVIVGDNHIGWDWTGGKFWPHIWNAGSLMRRNTDQAGHRPRLGIVMSDGSVQSHYLDTSRDKLDVFSGEEDCGPEAVGFAEVMNELRGLSGASLDFAQLLRLAMGQKGTDPRVANYLLEALEHGDPDRPKTR